jgi:hypothetical protein
MNPIISNGRENALIVHLRFRKTLSINQISTVLEHSTRSIWATVKVNELNTGRKFDRRTLKRKIRELDMQQFRRKLSELKIRAKLFLQGWVNTLEEAFNIPSVPLPIVSALASKNSTASSEADEPP